MEPSSKERERLRLQLVGGDHADGEIPLARLRDLAQHTQKLVLRIGRGLSGRDGAGRTPDDLQAATQLTLVGLGAGSTIVEIAGPTREPELDLGEDVEPNVTVQALRRLQESLGAVGDAGVALPALSSVAAESLDRWLAVVASYEEVTVSLYDGRGRSTSVSLSPTSARSRLAETFKSSEGGEPEVAAREIEGELYAVDLHSGRFGVEDDMGNHIPLRVTEVPAQKVRDLLGRRVQAIGDAILDEEGRIKHLTVVELEATRGRSSKLAPNVRDADDLQQRLHSATPITSVDDLVMTDLPDDEAEAFWEAIEHGRSG